MTKAQQEVIDELQGVFDSRYTITGHQYRVAAFCPLFDGVMVRLQALNDPLDMLEVSYKTFLEFEPDKKSI